MDRVTDELAEEERSIGSDDLSKSNISNLIADEEDDVVKASVTSEGAEFLDSTLGDNVPRILALYFCMVVDIRFCQ
jgi:hypothetical protein